MQKVRLSFMVSFYFLKLPPRIVEPSLSLQADSNSSLGKHSVKLCIKIYQQTKGYQVLSKQGTHRGSKSPSVSTIISDTPQGCQRILDYECCGAPVRLLALLSTAQGLSRSTVPIIISIAIFSPMSSGHISLMSLKSLLCQCFPCLFLVLGEMCSHLYGWCLPQNTAWEVLLICSWSFYQAISAKQGLCPHLKLLAKHSLLLLRLFHC